MARDVQCTVDGLQAASPCVKCLSRKELLALLIVIMADQLGYDLPDDNSEILEDSACFRCQSDRERLNGFMSKLVSEYRDAYTIEELREEIKCILCWDEVAIKSALALLLCQYIDYMSEPQ